MSYASMQQYSFARQTMPGYLSLEAPMWAIGRSYHTQNTNPEQHGDVFCNCAPGAPPSFPAVYHDEVSNPRLYCLARPRQHF